jgi:hypothetical protein
MDAAANPLDEGIKTLRRPSPSLPLWLLSLPLFLFPPHAADVVATADAYRRRLKAPRAPLTRCEASPRPPLFPH